MDQYICQIVASLEAVACFSNYTRGRQGIIGSTNQTAWLIISSEGGAVGTRNHLKVVHSHSGIQNFAHWSGLFNMWLRMTMNRVEAEATCSSWYWYCSDDKTGVQFMLAVKSLLLENTSAEVVLLHKAAENPASFCSRYHLKFKDRSNLRIHRVCTLYFLVSF